MKRKISTVQLFRHIVQFISFILFPGLFIMAYSSIKSVVMAIVNGIFSIDALSSDIAIMVAVLSITILFGRFFLRVYMHIWCYGRSSVLSLRICPEKTS